MTDPVEAEKLCPFSINDMVWAKVRGHPWWPAKMADPKVAPLAVRREMKPNMLLVKFYGQTNYGWIRPDYIKGFKEHQDEFGKKPSILEALKQALKDEKGGLGYDFLHDDPPSEDDSDESEDTSSFVDSSDLDESDEDDDDDLIDLKASRKSARALRKANGNEENRKRPNTNRLQKQQSASSTPSKTKAATQSQLLEEDLVRRSVRISCKKIMQQTRRSRRSRSRSPSSSPSRSRSSSRSRSPPSSESRSAENSRRYYLRTQSPTPIDDLFCSLDEDTASRILKPPRHKRSASSSTSSLTLDSPAPAPAPSPAPVVKTETPAVASPSISSPGPLADTPKKKLKRGRKPKKQLLEAALAGTPGATGSATNPGETPPVKVPGKRGRKRKLVVEDPISPGLEMNGSAATDNDPNPAKRRKLNNEAPSSSLVSPKSSIKQEPKDAARSATPTALVSATAATPTTGSHAGQTTSPQSDSNNSPSKQGACATPMKTPKAQKRFQPKKLIPVSLSFVRELQTHLTQAVSLRDDDLIETILHSLCMVKLTVEILRETGIAHQIRQVARQYDQNKNPIKQAARVVINGLKSNLTGELDSMALNMKDDLARSPPYSTPSSSSSSSSIPSKKQKKQPLSFSGEASSGSSSSSSILALSTDVSSQLPTESNGSLPSSPSKLSHQSEESRLTSPDAQSSSSSTTVNTHPHELQEAVSDTPMAPPSNGSALEDILDHPQQQTQQQQQQLPLLTSPATTVETHLIGSYLAAPTTSSSSSGDSVHLNQNFIINNHHHHHHHHGKNLIDVQTNVYSDPESASLKIKSEIQAKEISLGMILNPISPSASSPSSSTAPSLVHIPMNNGKFHHSTFQFHAQPSEQSPSSSPLTLPHPPPPPNVEFLPMPIHRSDQNVPPPHPHPLALPHPSPPSLLPSPSSSLSNILLPSHRPL
eukprot:TRINITY_DN1087_c2_g1_i1.p1 TRINITY_DN1087_c2_g1~~TRINITY_DN1087_c2_g1_i1.p1  ORF type:complete len:934 (+),score=413.34 TRINITY_DN1087_c2_g1_i1:231-3032(+)